jgi:hypothetical protein
MQIYIIAYRFANHRHEVEIEASSPGQALVQYFRIARGYQAEFIGIAAASRLSSSRGVAMEVVR